MGALRIILWIFSLITSRIEVWEDDKEHNKSFTLSSPPMQQTVTSSHGGTSLDKYNLTMVTDHMLMTQQAQFETS